MRSRALRTPNNVVVIGADLVNAAREIGHSEGRSEGYQDGYQAGLAFAIKTVGRGNGYTEEHIKNQLRKEMNKQ